MTPNWHCPKDMAESRTIHIFWEIVVQYSTVCHIILKNSIICSALRQSSTARCAFKKFSTTFSGYSNWHLNNYSVGSCITLLKSYMSYATLRHSKMSRATFIIFVECFKLCYCSKGAKLCDASLWSILWYCIKIK